ncbi:MAG: hypothetical protein WCQ21_29025 [Verrucomicrobiota bacterium]|jgi:hypothetical protein
MHLKAVILLGAVMAICGCSTTKEHAILKDLGMKERNSVHVALWTLQQNGILSSEESERIDLSPPYREVRPQIRAVQKRVRLLPEEKLSTLDESLAYHWRIYSTIWPSWYSWDISVEEEHRLIPERLSNKHLQPTPR